MSLRGHTVAKGRGVVASVPVGVYLGSSQEREQAEGHDAATCCGHPQGRCLDPAMARVNFTRSM
jgi:hypothetical protein